jgi:nitroreductase
VQDRPARQIDLHQCRCALLDYLDQRRQKHRLAVKGLNMATRREVNISILSSIAAAAASVPGLAQTSASIQLPPPALEGGKSLMQSLNARRSIRDFSDRPLSRQVISNLLWAAWGVNRPEVNGRTAPHWHNVYALDLYLAMADGVWLYEPKSHGILLHTAQDLRPQTTTEQSFVATAPLNLVYAFDTAKLTGTESEKTAASAACAAMAAENVYLYCASDGLATVFRQSVPGEALARSLRLPPSQIVQFAQTVGYSRT